MNRFNETYPQRIQREQQAHIDRYADWDDQVHTLRSLLDRKVLRQWIREEAYDPSMVQHMTQHQSMYALLDADLTARYHAAWADGKRLYDRPDTFVIYDDVVDMHQYVHNTYPSLRNMTKAQQMSVLYGSIGNKTYTAMSGSISGFRIVIAPENPVLHAFDAEGTYHELPDNARSIAIIPSGWYWLRNGDWYYRIVHRFHLRVSQVPKAYRLYLMLNQIDQPQE